MKRSRLTMVLIAVLLGLCACQSGSSPAPTTGNDPTAQWIGTLREKMDTDFYVIPEVTNFNKDQLPQIVKNENKISSKIVELYPSWSDGMFLDTRAFIFDDMSRYYVAGYPENPFTRQEDRILVHIDHIALDGMRSQAGRIEHAQDEIVLDVRASQKYWVYLTTTHNNYIDYYNGGTYEGEDYPNLQCRLMVAPREGGGEAALVDEGWITIRAITDEYLVWENRKMRDWEDYKLDQTELWRYAFLTGEKAGMPVPPMIERSGLDKNTLLQISQGKLEAPKDYFMKSFEAGFQQGDYIIMQGLEQNHLWLYIIDIAQNTCERYLPGQRYGIIKEEERLPTLEEIHHLRIDSSWFHNANPPYSHARVIVLEWMSTDGKWMYYHEYFNRLVKTSAGTTSRNPLLFYDITQNKIQLVSMELSEARLYRSRLIINGYGSLLVYHPTQHKIVQYDMIKEDQRSLNVVFNRTNPIGNTLLSTIIYPEENEAVTPYIYILTLPDGWESP